MKTALRLLAVALVAGGTMFAETRLSIGIGVGGYGPGYYYAPPAYSQYVPPCPGPDYTWVDGYWSPGGVWVDGYWRRPWVGGYSVAPRYDYGYRNYGYGYRGWDRDRDYGRRSWGRGERREERFENRGRYNGFRR